MNSPVAWALVFHIIGFVFWVGGLLVTTTVLALHTQQDLPQARLPLEHLEVKLLRGMAHPGAAITVLAGLTVVWIQPSYIHQHWLQAKLCLVAILIALDLVVYMRTKAFHKGEIKLERRECMILHGAISLVFLGIVILVLIKPF
jgi:protoporphyrinogen IX oxidase